MKTILYYTSNRESPEFEAKVQENILKQKGDLPIISVSQKPILFGKNICVGDVGHSYLNEYRQVLIGAKEAKTEYLVFAEADFLYAKEYFDFIPTGKNLYRYENDWIIFTHPAFKYEYYKKPYIAGTLICKRKFIISELEKYLADQPEWVDGEFMIRDKNGQPKIDYTDIKKFPEPFESIVGRIACVSFKTGRGVTQGTTASRERRKTLPYWGNGKELCFKMI